MEIPDENPVKGILVAIADSLLLVGVCLFVASAAGGATPPRALPAFEPDGTNLAAAYALAAAAFGALAWNL